jgi:hypothetical protein
VLDGIATRLDERRDLTRYLIGLLIFLGLLGTFWGLLETIGAVADAINGLQVTGGDAVQMFAKLKASIDGPLKGMATAFGASLFGLSGSLVLGFLELQASQAQGRFHIELEEWRRRPLSSGSGEQRRLGYVELSTHADGLTTHPHAPAQRREPRSDCQRQRYPGRAPRRPGRDHACPADPARASGRAFGARSACPAARRRPRGVLTHQRPEASLTALSRSVRAARLADELRGEFLARTIASLRGLPGEG